MRVKVAILYLIGVASLVFGFYTFWHDGVVNQHAFTAAAMCIMAAAGVQVALDLWSRVRQRLRK